VCGIVAYAPRPGGRVPPECHGALVKSVETLRFRGPDEVSTIDVDGALLGHTRLSIIDLSTGSQPIWNEDGSIAAILNGEIYNYRELRRDLVAAGHRFRTNSDTEVIVHLYEDMGDALFSELNGMFAIAIWDRTRHRLIAARDRMGEKPLNYFEMPEGLALASEIKALLEFDHVPRTIDQEALALYFTSSYVPAPLTIFRSIRKLLPGHVLVYDDKGLTVRRYWRLCAAPRQGRSVDDLIDEFTHLFSDAVRMRLVADVPLGVFLSGGIDSSAVAAHMARVATEPVQTFTVGFGSEIDERPFARMVAERYGTVHTELFVETRITEEFEHIYPYMDEPFGDSSLIPTHLVARAAREHVKVVLTGDGGDELFAGYPMYLDQKYRWGSRARTLAIRELNRAAIRWLNHDFVSHRTPRADRAFASWHDTRSVYGAEAVRRMLGDVSPMPYEFYFDRAADWRSADSLTTAFQYDITFYLADDLLKKVDMASMRASLECRAPFLDHRLVEWALSVPPGIKLQGDQPKWLLKQALGDVLPDPILRRGKQGFGAPLRSWLTGPLRALALDLTARGCRSEQLIPRAAIDAARRPLLNGAASDNAREFEQSWLILVLERWMRAYA
jgi:asparagine synthase (glutamine-hydrolysing)